MDSSSSCGINGTGGTEDHSSDKICSQENLLQNSLEWSHFKALNLPKFFNFMEYKNLKITDLISLASLVEYVMLLLNSKPGS